MTRGGPASVLLTGGTLEKSYTLVSNCNLQSGGVDKEIAVTVALLNISGLPLANVL